MRLNFAVLMLAMLLTGCAGDNNAPPLTAVNPAHVDAAEAPYVPPASVLVDDRTAPPTPPSKDDSKKDDVTPAHEHGASPATGNPAAASATTGATSATQPGKNDVYTCPMHPEVMQSAPGRCPKCGMSLVKKSGDAGHDQHTGGSHE